MLPNMRILRLNPECSLSFLLEFMRTVPLVKIPPLYITSLCGGNGPEMWSLGVGNGCYCGIWQVFVSGLPTSTLKQRGYSNREKAPVSKRGWLSNPR